MTDNFAEATTEIALVNAAGLYVVITTAKWGEYFGEPGNIVSMVVSVCAIGFTIVRTSYYLQQKRYAREDREEARKSKTP